MHNRIPLPAADNPQFKDVMDYWYQLNQAKTQRSQFAETKEMQKEQFAKNYELQKQAQNRANSLLPYMIQQYKDTHNKNASEAEIKQIYSGLMKDALLGNNSDSVENNSFPFQKNSISNQNNPNAINSGNEQNMQEMKNNIQPNMNNFQQQDMSQENQPNPGQMQNPAMNQNQQIPEMQEQEVRPGNPRLSKLDKVAGLVPGIPKPEIHYMPNGMAVTKYPSGRVTIQNMSNIPGMKSVSQETPEERENREIRTRTASANAVQSAKEGTEIKKSARSLANSAALVEQLDDILSNNPGLTGITPGLAAKTNLSRNEKLGSFITTAGKLQAELGKYASQRGGIQAVKWAASVKPSEWKSGRFNTGMIKAIRENLASDYNRLQEEYKDATGQDLPVRLPNASNQTPKQTEQGQVVLYKDGKEYHIPPNLMKKALSEGFTLG